MYLTVALLFIGIGLLLLIYYNINKFVKTVKSKPNDTYEEYLSQVSTNLTEEVHINGSYIRYYVSNKDLILICTLNNNRYCFSLYNEDTGNKVKISVYNFFKELNLILPEYNIKDKKETILDKLEQDSKVSLLDRKETNVTIIS